MCENKRVRFFTPVYEFHMEKKLRRKYEIEEAFFSTNGNILFTDFRAVRLFVHKINKTRKPDQHIYPGEVNGAGLLEEIFHFVFREYEKKRNPKVFAKAFVHLEKTFGEKDLADMLLDFLEKFPSTPIFNAQLTIDEYLKGKTEGRANSHICLEELVMLFFANFNPANEKLKEFFDDKHLDDPVTFRRMIDELEDFFEEQPGFGPDDQDIFSLFKTPILNAPEDISKQIDFILEKWKQFLPEKILNQLLKSKDLLREDVRFDTMGGNGGPPTIAPRYKGMGEEAGMFTLGKSGYKYLEDAEKDYEEHEQFTQDVHWMPSVVMLAKNTYVWLDQLSKRYGREIKRLDQVPDEELDRIKRSNFTGLWLIGIWERSEASRRIKHIMGNTDAVSSAYSLYDYVIAEDLGGEEAYQNLNERTKTRGIRLASDMVPNHTGIYSKWVIENPDYFIQAPAPPFPGYTFNGENLSQHPDYDIRIEDGYFSKTDAAVVFQRINKKTGETRYIYHGNDGTVMPWNDTAQLDMLKQEVREAVIQKIFEVARRFSIIRFDAAMTLAKKHFSRLWYPRPGSGGDIPSRADYAMTQREFDALFPVEFWREVVDRMNAELPETLLLAEAFWFMEGYFVRTLGMHRVYNSAFMHMLKNEENEKYRDLITNTLEFEPEILKRYVNFMSNPDEETAIRQFDTGDKYFGVCMLMSTLPGLPMFAHGQIEGYSEKYGMEYQRAYYNEEPTQWLVEKHEREIFPVTRKRYLFSEVFHFNIFDYIDSYGNVNENVFAFTNRYGNERALVLYNNKYEQAHGHIRFSAPKLTAAGNGKETLTVSLVQALDMKGGDKIFYAFREHISGLEYLKKGNEILENGLHWNLNGFEYRLFWEFREIYDETGEYEKLYRDMGGEGVSSIEKAIEEIQLQPLHDFYEALFSEDIINFIVNRVLDENRSIQQKPGYNLLKSRFAGFIEKMKDYGYLKAAESEVLSGNFITYVRSIEKAFDFIFVKEKHMKEYLQKYGLSSLNELLTIGSKSSYRENLVLLLAYYSIKTIQNELPEKEDDDLLQNTRLYWPLQKILKRTGRGDLSITRDINLLMLLLKEHGNLFDFSKIKQDETNFDIDKVHYRELMDQKIAKALEMLDDEFIRNFMGVNEYRNIIYFSKECYQELIDWFFSISVLGYFTYSDADLSKRETEQLQIYIGETVRFLMNAREMSGKAGYQMELLKKQIHNQQLAKD
ncbi:MAG: hypothetical protein K0B37_00170 [Bacteroidales bacterium]|nr:hypothetical protein [Bacteroidales bacterium]